MERIGVRHMENEKSGNPQIIFVGGYLNSGKGTYCANTLKHYVRIGVSDIIRGIIGQSTRKELQDTAHLDIRIAQSICHTICTNTSMKYVIDGIRQKSIFDRIENFITAIGITSYRCIWLDTSLEECKKRFLAKVDNTKENISFESAFDRDKSLGILQLEQHWKENKCIVIKN